MVGSSFARDAYIDSRNDQLAWERRMVKHPKDQALAVLSQGRDNWTKETENLIVALITKKDAAIKSIEAERDALAAQLASLRVALTSIESHELRDHEDYEAIKDIASSALRQSGDNDAQG